MPSVKIENLPVQSFAHLRRSWGRYTRALERVEHIRHMIPETHIPWAVEPVPHRYPSAFWTGLQVSLVNLLRCLIMLHLPSSSGMVKGR